MLTLDLPWWHFPLRAAIVYATLLLLVRLGGKRTVGEFTPFDLIVVILLGEAAQNAMVGGDTSLLGGLICAATLIAMNYAVGFASTRSARIDRLVEGEPVILVRDGVVRHAALLRNNVPESDLREALRKNGVLRPEDVALAVLETDGRITVISAREGE